jgi:aarF domain-containing kinase
MCRDYYTLQFMDPSVDTRPIAPALQAFFDDVLDASVSQLNFKAIVDGLGAVLFEYPFRWAARAALCGVRCIRWKHTACFELGVATTSQTAV